MFHSFSKNDVCFPCSILFHRRKSLFVVELCERGDEARKLGHFEDSVTMMEQARQLADQHLSQTDTLRLTGKFDVITVTCNGQLNYSSLKSA